MSRRRSVLILLPVVLMLTRGSAEASRYDFNGAGGDVGAELMVWDGDFTVSTESNVCNGQPCTTLPALLPGFGFVISGVGANLTTLNTLAMVFMSPTVGCGGNSNCGTFSDFFESTGNPNEYNAPTLGFGGREINTTNFRQLQPIPAGLAAPNVFLAYLSLPATPSFDGQTFTTPLQATDAGLINAFLAAPDLRVGMLVTFNYTGAQSPNSTPVFTLEQVSAAVADPSVPEPATLTLVGTVLAARFARRRGRAAR